MVTQPEWKCYGSSKTTAEANSVFWEDAEAETFIQLTMLARKPNHKKKILKTSGN